MTNNFIPPIPSTTASETYVKSGSVIELKFGEDAKSNGDLLSAVSDYTNLASRFTLTVGDNTDTAFTLTSGANDTLTFTIDNEADYVQNDEQVISIAYNATGAADDLSDATNTLQKTSDFTQAVTNNFIPPIPSTTARRPMEERQCD